MSWMGLELIYFRHCPSPESLGSHGPTRWIGNLPLEIYLVCIVSFMEKLFIVPWMFSTAG